MKKFTSVITTAGAAALLATGMGFSGAAMAEDAGLSESAKKGKEIAFGRGAGNCLACHQMKGGNLAGNIGPALIAMEARYPEREDLVAVLKDPRDKFGDQTIMPPFGANKILSDEEINNIVDYLYTL
ncbi:sulfur oxidation c-type cytochrome SoxX [Guyparkeria hydrothermalis]|uniref:sulfur oxidation c-type cytochrome SoxX n=1 Tax=Guyparkeria TaxID=2035712 RepID=UPI0010AC5DED|nr:MULTISPECIES: sulfur oxidation c-type cytochrome SoxX [Guyparkeria]MCL7751809.1 sulfur oxidation c-type cytochrome SoxX [Guyparkeria hydrothermalis]TKA89326.1 sulfur oxidation c-type cytochrome SoxX [Guyparkeria sp. SB14A]